MSTTTATRTATYTADGSTVRIEGERKGFVYITFTDGRNAGTTTKVPPSWIVEDVPAPAEACPTSGRTAAWCTDQSHVTCGNPTSNRRH